MRSIPKSQSDPDPTFSFTLNEIFLFHYHCWLVNNGGLERTVPNFDAKMSHFTNFQILQLTDFAEVFFYMF